MSSLETSEDNFSELMGKLMTFVASNNEEKLMYKNLLDVAKKKNALEMGFCFLAGMSNGMENSITILDQS